MAVKVPEKDLKKETDQGIQSAQRYDDFSKLFSPEEKKFLENAQPEDFLRFLDERDFTNSQDLLTARSDWLRYRNVKPFQTTEETSQPVSNPLSERGGGVGALAGAGLSALIPRKKLTYESHIAEAEKYAEKMARIWDKKPDPNKTRQEVYDAAMRTREDGLVLLDEELAKKWAAEHQNPGLASAVDRKRVQNDKITYEEFKAISKQYAEGAVGEWDKKPDPNKTRQAAYDTAERDIHDTFANSIHSKQLAKEWATKHGDLQIKAAL